MGTVDGQVCVFAAEKKGNKLEVKLSHKVDLKVGKKPVDQLLVSTSKAKVVALCGMTGLAQPALVSKRGRGR